VTAGSHAQALCNSSQWHDGFAPQFAGDFYLAAITLRCRFKSFSVQPTSPSAVESQRARHGRDNDGRVPASSNRGPESLSEVYSAKPAFIAGCTANVAVLHTCSSSADRTEVAGPAWCNRNGSTERGREETCFHESWVSDISATGVAAMKTDLQ
jgi:hypothetical protein